MSDFLNKMLSAPVAVGLIAEIVVGILIIIIIFIFLQSKQNKKSRENMKRDIIYTQEELFSNAAELLAKKLAEYTDRVLVEKVDNHYNKLITKDLLPTVSEATKRIADMSEEAMRRQENGIKEMAVMLADLLSSKTTEYIKMQEDVIVSMQNTTAVFSNELNKVTENINELSKLYTNAYEQSNAVTVSVSSAATLLGEKIIELGNVMDSTSHSVALMQAGINDNNEMIKNMRLANEQTQSLALNATNELANHNEKTANMFNEAVNAMQVNTENAAKGVLSEFSTNLNETTNAISNTVNILKEITENINSSANNFSTGISNIYNDFGTNLDKNLSNVTEKINEAVSAEYKKIVSSAETYSSSFTGSINNLNTSLDAHINNLQTISSLLNNNISNFKGDVDSQTNRFELSMEKSVSEALSQIDNSLAEIVKRLVSVTVSIQEAADALPKAVKAVKDKG